MTEKTLLEALKLIAEISPFSRIRASEALIDRFNTQFNENLTEFAITVAKGVAVSDEELWDFMTDKNRLRERATVLDFGDLSWRRAPETGVAKSSIID